MAPLGPLVEQWNTDLEKAMETFQSRHHDITTTLYDVNALFNKVLDKPTSYGFKSAGDICEGDCIWYDGLHPGSTFYKILAEEFAKNYTEPLEKK